MGRRARLGLVAAIFASLGIGAWSASQAESFGPLPEIDRIEVHKADRAMLLFAHGRQVARIDGIQLGGEPVGAKRFEGDRKTPQGHYTIDSGKYDSDYHLALHVSYPNAADRAYAAARGRSPGGGIFIHGQPNDWPAGRVPGDWTAGCIALSDDQIETLWAAAPVGTAVDIAP